METKNYDDSHEYFPIISENHYDENREEMVDWANHLNLSIEICDDELGDNEIMLGVCGKFNDIQIWAFRWMTKEQRDSAMVGFNWVLHNWYIDINCFTLDPSDDAYECTNNLLDWLNTYGIEHVRLGDADESAVSDFYVYRFRGTRDALLMLGHEKFDMTYREIHERLEFID